MRIIQPPPLRIGDVIGIIAPAASAALIHKENLNLAKKRLESFGFRVVYGNRIFTHSSPSIENVRDRVHDLHRMFLSKKVKAIMAVMGGHTSNQLLPHLDYELIKKHPKVFIGFSDITALQNAIFRKTGLVTFSGPCFANFAQIHPPFDFEANSFRTTLMEGSVHEIQQSPVWAEDQWWRTLKKKRELKKNSGWRIIRHGKAKGVIVGGNLSTFLLLFGTPYAPSLRDKLIFLEEDPSVDNMMIERMLTQVSQNSDFPMVRGIVVGRFGSASDFHAKEEASLLRVLTSGLDIPVISNLDFGHTNPMITFPIGGECEIDTKKRSIKIGC